MTVAEGTATPRVSSAPSRWDKIKESLKIFASSKVAVVGFCLVAFWVIVSVFTDDCTFRPTLWASCLAGEREAYDQTSNCCLWLRRSVLPWLGHFRDDSTRKNCWFSGCFRSVGLLTGFCFGQCCRCLLRVLSNWHRYLCFQR